VLLAAFAAGLVSLHAWLSQWYDRTWLFVSAVGLALALLAALAYVVTLAGPPLWRVLASVARSAWRGVVSDPELARLARRWPRTALFVQRRLDTTQARGFALTAIVVLAAWFLSWFASIAEDVVTVSSITRYDPQITALLRAFRTPTLTRLLWGFTVLGDTRVAAVLALVAAAIALLWGLRREALVIAMSVAGGSALVAVAKLLFHRPRPDMSLALISTPGSFSFPSGHAAYTLLLLGSIALLVVVSRRALWVKVTVLAACVACVALVGLSRVYLGVHWASDVLASWSLALAWLTVTVGAYLTARRHAPPTAMSARPGAHARSAATVAVLAVAVAVVVFGAVRDPLLAHAAATPGVVQWTSSAPAGENPLTAAHVHELPRFSEKLDGSPQEPIGVIFIGSEVQLVHAFEAAGWTVADAPSIATLIRAIVAASANSAYPSAPVTPTFMAGDVQDVAFEKPEGQATVRRRHHCRWWKTRFRLNGEPVWVATASFDSRLEIGSAIPLPTHHVDPDIDAEQRYLVAGLVRAGAADAVARVKVSSPMSGTDAQGDAFFTQGRATVLLPAR
jgi:undecaprenyl-diphosphatase